MPSADDYGIDYTGATDVTLGLANAINAQPPGTTFTLHADGLYLINPSSTQPNPWTAPGIVIDGQGAKLFRNVRRTGYTITNRYSNVDLQGAGMTLRNLESYGYRADDYTGDQLTTVAGTPTVVSTTVQLNAQNEEVRLPKVGLDWMNTLGVFLNFETPYYFRSVDGLNRWDATLSDSAQVPNDCVFAVVDDTTGAVLDSTTLTLTGTPTVYELTFDPGETYLGTPLRITVRKATATANTITVGQITAYGEAGYRRRTQAGYTGGDEFSHGIRIGAVTGVTITDCHVEGPDGDFLNASPESQSLTVERLTGRGNGRQGIVLERSDHVVFTDCHLREVGRSGVDYEPNRTTQLTQDSSFTDCTFLNVRNYTFAMSKFAQCEDVTLTNITSTHAGMGPIYGGARGMTITNFVHTDTYRTEEDRLANGGYAGADWIAFGIDITGTGLVTDIGARIPYFERRYDPGTGIIVYSPDNVHLSFSSVANPTLDPPYVIEPGVTNSSIEGVSSGGTAVWDSQTATWDAPNVLWDGADAPSDVGPAFQTDAFQTDAFQVFVRVAQVAQTAPGVTQSSEAFVGHPATVVQEAPAPTQAAVGDLQVSTTLAQTTPSVDQSAAGDLEVHGVIGVRTLAFQADFVQADAFQFGETTGQTTGAVTQQAFGGVFTPPANVGEINQTTAAPTQAAATGDIAVEGSITQTTPALAQGPGWGYGPWGKVGWGGSETGSIFGWTANVPRIIQTTGAPEQWITARVVSTARPFIAALVPTWARPRDLVEIIGANLTGATAVTLNGSPTLFTVVSSESITFTVPRMLDGFYEVLVTSPLGTSEGGHQLQVAKLHEGRRDDRGIPGRRKILAGAVSAPALVENTEGT